MVQASLPYNRVGTTTALYFSLKSDSLPVPNLVIEFAKCSPSVCKSDYYLVIYIGILGYDAAEVGEFVDVGKGLSIDSVVRGNIWVAWTWLV